ncbi:nitrogen regulation protein NR(II) [Pistricoccus aurantiacus]|uniref:histidine kinase n=1 Tax=Pistricoccus aurantiacus TaxID=1883414 RepID=A0A5B8SN30_9GAMM|nr:nitrogen regulation protein NR(II) [Pistricoccus aurantiacus]QEA38106.1 nitrogen regulation protein NR(II) [Pistricoccus aurantiacus]
MYRRLLEHLSTAILLLDVQLRLRWMNPAAEALMRLSLERMQGMRLDHLEGAIIEVMSRARAAGCSYTQREAVIALPSGEGVTVDVTVTPLPEDELLLEIEPRDRLLRISREEALLAHQTTIKTLTRGLAHEIKNPLGGIRGAAQLLERELIAPGLSEYTQVIIQEADRLRDLVDRMLGPNHRIAFATLNIHQVAERVRALLSAEHVDIEIRRDYDPSLPELLGDEAQLIQALLNVARNAMQAMEESAAAQPTLTLRTRARRQFTLGAERHRLVCEIAVIDNGPGIPRALRDTLFYPMVSGRAKGRGLGLSIAQAAMHQHQGLIECDSIPGHTEFRLLLPVIKQIPSSPSGDIHA